MEDLEKSFAAMDLFSIDDLDRLVAKMKMEHREKISLSDLVINLKNLKMEKSNLTASFESEPNSTKFFAAPSFGTTDERGKESANTDGSSESPRHGPFTSMRTEEKDASTPLIKFVSGIDQFKKVSKPRRGHTPAKQSTTPHANNGKSLFVNSFENSNPNQNSGMSSEQPQVPGQQVNPPQSAFSSSSGWFWGSQSRSIGTGNVNGIHSGINAAAVAAASTPLHPQFHISSTSNGLFNAIPPQQGAAAATTATAVPAAGIPAPTPISAQAGGFGASSSMNNAEPGIHYGASMATDVDTPHSAMSTDSPTMHVDEPVTDDIANDNEDIGGDDVDRLIRTRLSAKKNTTMGSSGIFTADSTGTGGIHIDPVSLKFDNVIGDNGSGSGLSGEVTTSTSTGPESMSSSASAQPAFSFSFHIGASDTGTTSSSASGLGGLSGSISGIGSSGLNVPSSQSKHRRGKAGSSPGKAEKTPRVGSAVSSASSTSRSSFELPVNAEDAPPSWWGRGPSQENDRQQQPWRSARGIDGVVLSDDDDDVDMNDGNDINVVEDDDDDDNDVMRNERVSGAFIQSIFEKMQSRAGPTASNAHANLAAEMNTASTSASGSEKATENENENEVLDDFDEPSPPPPPPVYDTQSHTQAQSQVHQQMPTATTQFQPPPPPLAEPAFVFGASLPADTSGFASSGAASKSNRSSPKKSALNRTSSYARKSKTPARTSAAKPSTSSTSVFGVGQGSSDAAADGTHNIGAGAGTSADASTSDSEPDSSDLESDDREVGSKDIGHAEGTSSVASKSSPKKDNNKDANKQKGGRKENKEKDDSQDDADQSRMAVLADMYRKQGSELYKENSFERALDAFEKALKFAPPKWVCRAQVYGNKAATLMMMSRFIEAADDCAEALKEDPTIVKLHTRRGRALLRLGHFAAADEAFMRVLETPSVTANTGIGAAGAVASATAAAAAEKELEAAKSDARNGLKALAGAKASMRRLNQMEASGDFKGVLATVNELMQHCPASSLIHISRANALCKLQRWSDAKEAVEEYLTSTHITVLKLEAHIAAVMPPPEVTRLAWTEKLGKYIVSVDAEAVIQAMLCMGPGLSQPYMLSLKNMDASRNCSADVMSRILLILTELCTILKASAAVVADMSGQTQTSQGRAQQDLGAWSWAPLELNRTKELIDWKNKGDRHFRNAQHVEAVQAYTQAIKADPLAVRWSAILYNNRAASHMGMGKHDAAVADCNQALHRDSDYARAYLRRARANVAIKAFAAAIRDFRRYLCTDPPPSDSAQVNQELDAAMEANRRQMREDQQRHEFERSFNSGSAGGGAGGGRGNTAGSNASSSSSGNGARPNTSGGIPDMRSRYAAAGANAYARGGSAKQQQGASTGARGNTSTSSGWTSDDEEKFNFYKQQHYRRWTAGNGASSSSSSHSQQSKSHNQSYGFAMSDDEDDDDDDDDYDWGAYARAAGGAGSSTRSAPSSSSARPGNTHGGHNRTASGSLSPLREGDHYHVLGVEPSANERTIKLAYRKLALKYHPDKNKDPGAEERFKVITSAYSVLVDKTQRDQYDRTRRVANFRKGW